MIGGLGSRCDAVLRAVGGAGHSIGSAQAVAWIHRGHREFWVHGRTADAQWTGAAVTLSTQFDLASLTKPMATATLLAQALGRGDVACGQTLESLLPLAKGTRLGQATLGQLASHSSGAPAWLDFFAATEHTPADQRQKAVQALVLDTPLTHLPGQRAIYSDLGYMALGWMLEAQLGGGLDELFARHVAGPLDLEARYQRISAAPSTRSAAVATELWAPRDPHSPLRGVVHDDNAAALDGVAGHAGLFASVGDVATWASNWLGAVRSTRNGPFGPLGLNPDVTRWMSQTAGCPGTTWRHGWDTPSRPLSSAGRLVPRDAFGHLGFSGTSVWLAPRANALAVVLTNRVHPTRTEVEGIRSFRPQLHDALWALLRRTTLPHMR